MKKQLIILIIAITSLSSFMVGTHHCTRVISLSTADLIAQKYFTTNFKVDFLNATQCKSMDMFAIKVGNEAVNDGTITVFVDSQGNILNVIE